MSAYPEIRLECGEYLSVVESVEILQTLQREILDLRGELLALRQRTERLENMLAGDGR